jgi:hypothetical protein
MRHALSMTGTRFRQAATDRAPAVRLGRVVGKRRDDADSPPEELIDQTLADSFPASDPPSWVGGRRD